MIIEFEAISANDLKAQVKDLAIGLGLIKQDPELETKEIKIPVADVIDNKKADLSQVSPVQDADGGCAPMAPSADPPKRRKSSKQSTSGAGKKMHDKSKTLKSSDDKKPLSAVTKADALDALQKVNSKLGLPAAKDILAAFECSRLSELKETDYLNFVHACEKALN
jgi:hypothetical protein